MAPTTLLAEEGSCKSLPNLAWRTNSQTKLSQARGLALQRELLRVFKGKPFQEKVTKLMMQQLEPQAFYSSFKIFVKRFQADVLSKYSFDENDTGMAEIAALALEACLRGPQAAPLADLIWKAKVADAVDMLQDLLKCFSGPRFQMKLNMLHRGHHPCSADFGEQLTSLLAPVYAQVLVKYGFTGDNDGLEGMTLALGRVMYDVEVGVLATAIDSALYGAMEHQAKALAPESQSRRRLEKRQVLQLLREQLAAFSDPNFQHEIAALRGSMRADDPDLAMKRAELALPTQHSILLKFGLEGSLRGAHSMLQLCAQHIWDPEVARLSWGIHFLLGMDKPEVVVNRLRCMQMEVSLP